MSSCQQKNLGYAKKQRDVLLHSEEKKKQSIEIVWVGLDTRLKSRWFQEAKPLQICSKKKAMFKES